MHESPYKAARWFDAGVERGAKWMLVIRGLNVLRPHYILKDFWTEYRKAQDDLPAGCGVVEVYDLEKDRDAQCRSVHAWNPPPRNDGQVGLGF